MIVGLALLLGVCLGVMAGGRLSALRCVRLKGEGLLAGLFAVQIVLPMIRLAAPFAAAVFWVWVVTIATTAAIAFMNWKLPGMVCVGVGFVLNCVVIVANAGMPVLPYAALAAGASEGSWIPPVGDFVHVVCAETTRFGALADVLPIPRPILSVASAGDILLLVGVSVALAGLMSGRYSSHTSQRAGVRTS